MKSPGAIIGLFCIVLLTSCAGNIAKWKPVIPDSFHTSIVVSDTGRKNVKLLYTGCGGMLISYKEEALLTDPFYTGQNFWRVATGIKTNEKNSEKVLKTLRDEAGVNTKKINNVLIAHSHYDHLLDLPFLLKQNILNDSVTVIGSQSTHCTIDSFMRTGQQYINADTISYVYDTNATSPVRWITLSTHMRVLMIKAEHAPHIGKHIKLMKGSTCDHKRLANFTDPTEHTCAFSWRQGIVYSWLIDVLDDNGKIELRMFMQSSSCDSPAGFPPPHVLKEKDIDIAMIGVASAQNVHDQRYPQALLSYLKPNKIILIHWEDFFRDLYHKKAKTVRATSFKKFFKRLRNQYQCANMSELASMFIMPRPLTLIDVKY